MKERETETRELVIIGAGPAGMSAAIAAHDAGVSDVLVLERDDAPGGILQQCIHTGFGIHRFGEELSGPEYAARFEERVRERGIECRFGTTVLSLSADRVLTVTSEAGLGCIRAEAVILSMGCRERPAGALRIPGDRPAGVFSAGAAQRYVNRMGYLPGKDVVILGSGDIGLIMARRMTLGGAKVHAVCELMPYSGGLARNIQQCLHDFGIPLYLSHTVVELHGRERLEGVTVARVDEALRPIAATRRFIPCDTLLLSVGLIPENELTRGAGISLHPVTGGAAVDQDRETDIPGIYAAGNVLHVHDLVDFVSEEAEIAGRAAAMRIRGEVEKHRPIPIRAEGGVRYTVPQRITRAEDVTVYFRVSEVLRNVNVTVTVDGACVLRRRRPRVAPGEMETVRLKKEWIDGAGEICLALEEAK